VTALEVRPALESDFEEWLALFEEVAAEGRWIGAEAPVHRDWARRTFEHRLESEQAATFVAQTDGLLVGQLGVDLARGVADLGMMVRKSTDGAVSDPGSSKRASPGPTTTVPTRSR
jgi:ribosomal protein S18 acetylase RimI-like enzyme